MRDRYSRQELFSGIGTQGQQKISRKHVLIIGAGALGTGNAEALTRAGVGKITIVDRDYVEWSNLGRQQLYSEQDAIERLPKAVAAKKRLSSVNSSVEINALVADVSVSEIEDLVQNVDLILDATDNFDVRMLINDTSHKHGIAWIYGACVGSYGLTYTIIPGQTPCLHCLLGSVPLGGATCDTAGIIAPAVQMVVSYQTAEALKILVEDWKAIRPTLVSFDLWTNQHASVKVGGLKKENCETCGSKPTYPFLQFENQLKTAVLCGRDTVQIRPVSDRAPNLEHLAGYLGNQGTQVEKNAYLISFQAGANRVVVFQDGRALIHGTKDVAEAKTIYHRYLG